MGRLVQVRDVPEDVHRVLKARASRAGVSFSDYLRGELALIAARPTPEEVLERLRAQPPLTAPAAYRPERILRRSRGPLR